MVIFTQGSIFDIGGKAYNLNALQNNDFLVPDFFVVSIDSIDELNIKKNIDNIMMWCNRIGGNFFSVRSSATCEDNDTASFAGLFESCICVRLNRIIDAISVVYNSSNSDRVLSYIAQNERARSLVPFKMRIIVQRQIDSDLSGVCHVHRTPNGNDVIIESCYGQGEYLVSGEITPDTYIISYNNGIFSLVEHIKGLQSKIMKPLTDEMHGIDNVSVVGLYPVKRSEERMLSNDELVVITDMCISASLSLDYYNADIEWCIADNTFYFTQIRRLVQ